MTAPPVLDAEALIADVATSESASTEDFEFAAALGVLAEALERQARLTTPGRHAVRSGLAGALAVQTRLSRLVGRHPEIEQLAVPRPVFVTGLLRTGTTLVHNLLALHPGLRAPALWEMMHPVSGDGATDEALADATQAYVEEYYRVAPDLPMIHFLDARRPDECHRLTGNAFTTMVYEMRYRVPDYGDWLATHDHRGAYRFHRRQLQAILWRRPGGTVVLKDPFHVWQLPALADVYPDARIVHMHRDPAVTVPSTCSLCAAIRVARSDKVDAEEIGRQWLHRVETGIDALPKARDALGLPVLDVRYADLVADPIATIARICDFIDVPMTTGAEQNMRAYLANNPSDRHGRHRYTAADFGLDPRDLRDRFSAYCDDYGV